MTVALARPLASLGATRLWQSRIVTAFVLTAAAFLLRYPSFGDPAIDIDEQFYLLVGDRMLHGAVPYVDIWDRKPIGLFLIYAAIRLLGGNGIWAYQIVATLFAAAGAFLISRIARKVAAEPAATVAGLAYLVWIETVGGAGGQSPVFYNPLVAGAALATLTVIEAPGAERAARSAFLAMVLGGLAIQIKYTAVFEVGMFGLLLAVSFWIERPSRRPWILIPTLAAVAFAPTIAAAATYAAMGEAHAFFFANFGSILLRHAEVDGQSAHRLAVGMGHLLPLAVCGTVSLWRSLRGGRRDRQWTWFLLVWLGAAGVGYVSVGAFYYHYLLPLYVPLAVLIAPAVGNWPTGIGCAAISLWIPFANLDWPDFAGAASSQEQILRLAALLPPAVKQDCLYEFDGPSILFELSDACAVSKFVFPDHLASRVEEHAIGVDATTEVARILAAKPAAITIAPTPAPNRNPQTARLVRSAVNRYYRLAGSATPEGRRIDVYVRR